MATITTEVNFSAIRQFQRFTSNALAKGDFQFNVFLLCLAGNDSSSYLRDIIRKISFSEIETEKNITLVEALAATQIPITQKLAALQVQTMGNSSLISKRFAIYNLFISGGHCKNWNQLSAQCLVLINEFIEDLSQPIRNISTLKSADLLCKTSPTTATEAAENILLRQYNAIYGIRIMVPVAAPGLHLTCPKPLPTAQRINAYFDNLYKQFQAALYAAFRRIPGLYYMFDEPEGARAAFLLSNSQIIVWISQGLGGICEFSFKQDQYDVMQTVLPQVINALLRLKQESDKLNNVLT
uniref:Uncharacterized protein n=1 Tax=Glossina brevipalpis TaxID=37001 RepID=A0A1A9W6C3_9MUSC